MEFFAVRLKKLREENKITIRGFAKILGISHAAYRKYELNTSEPSQTILIKMAEHLGVTVGYLLGVEDY